MAYCDQLTLINREPPLLSLRKELKNAFAEKNDTHCIQLIDEIRTKRDVKDEYCRYGELLKESMIWCAQFGSIDVLSSLLQSGDNADPVDVYGNSPIILASEKGHVEIVKLLLQNSCDVNRSDLETRTALHWSSMMGHTEVVELLLAHGAIPDKKDGVYGYTALMLAARQGHAAIVKILLNRNCNPDQLDIHHESALFDAVRNGQEKCVKLLLSAGAKFNGVDQYGRTVLLAAVLWNRTSIVALLVKQNCRLDVAGCRHYVHNFNRGPNDFRDNKLFTPIEAAIMEGKKQISYILYTAGANRSLLYKYVRDGSLVEYIKKMTGNDEIDKMIDWLRCIMKDPRSLKEQCRIVIRQNCLEITRFTDLNLPKPLIEYLHIPEIDEYL